VSVALGEGAPPVEVTIEAGERVRDIDFRPTRITLGTVVAAGPGKVVPAGPGRGSWRVYDVTRGLAKEEAMMVVAE
jgi:hypothetical protein